MRKVTPDLGYIIGLLGVQEINRLRMRSSLVADEI
jgi:hypothetical protein